MERKLYDTRGRVMDPFHLRPEDCGLDEIAVRLARRCRWAAAVPYTVAEHSIAVALAVAADGHEQELQRVALLHDASEAWLGDMPAPLRHGLEWWDRNRMFAEQRLYDAVEADAGLVIAGRYGLADCWLQNLQRTARYDLDHRAMEASLFWGDLPDDDHARLQAILDPHGLRLDGREPRTSEITDCFCLTARFVGLE